MSSKDWMSIILAQVWFLPYLAVCLLGILACLFFMSRFRLPSLLAFFALLILLGGAFSSVGLSIWISVFDHRGVDVEDLGTAMRVVAVFQALTSSTGLAMLIAAVFTGRKQPGANVIIEKPS